jgi:hypothetical protein
MSERPESYLETPAPFQTVAEAIKSADLNKAEGMLKEIGHDLPEDKDWVDYFTGILKIEQKNWQEAEAAFMRVYDRVGWLARNEKKYETAYRWHATEAAYIQPFGSFLEIHDACISCDMDAYYLEDWHLSRYWLEMSIGAADEIPDDLARNQCLGTSLNNLSGTLIALRDFEHAAQAAEASLEHWDAYVKGTDGNGRRLVWAHFAVGDAYAGWATQLAGEEDETAREKARLAHEALTLASKEAHTHGMDESESRIIHERMENLKGLLE